MRERATCRRTLIILTILAGTLPALLAIAPQVHASPGVAGNAAATAHGTAAAGKHKKKQLRQKLCDKGEHIIVRNRWHHRFVVRNDYFRRPGCLWNWKGHPNFRVANSYDDAANGKVVAYPDIFSGCAWGVCSPRTKLPREISRLRHPQVTWRAKGLSAGGRWSAAFDIWISKHKMTTGQAQGAELMIWLKVHRLGSARGWPKVWVGHHPYYLLHWIAGRPDGSRWNYIQFRRVHPATGVFRLGLRRFIRKAEHRGLIKPWWWLDNIEAGFEIWSGGKGLGTKKFWANQ